MTISEIASKAARKLPPDVLTHPLPFPSRLDYAEKIIKEAIQDATIEIIADRDRLFSVCKTVETLLMASDCDWASALVRDDLTKAINRPPL